MKECGKNCILSKVKDKSHAAKIMSQTANNIVELDIISSADTNFVHIAVMFLSHPI